MRHWSYTCVIHVIVFAIAFLNAIPAFAQESQQAKAANGADPASIGVVDGKLEKAVPEEQSQPHKPVLVVSARTRMAMEADFVLDVRDLARQFVQRLADYRIESVPLLAPAELKAVGPGTYLLDVSIDGWRESARSGRTTYNQTVEYWVFCVDLTLSLRNLESGLSAQKLLQYNEGAFQSGSDRSAIKRAVIQDAITNLADRFVSEATLGKYGPGLATIQPPPIQETWLEKLWSVSPGWIVAGGVIVLVVVLVIILANAPDEPLPPAPRYPKHNPFLLDKWDIELQEAIALSIATDSFSDIACEAEARVHWRRSLEQANEIELDEAARILSQNDQEKKYRQMAAYAAHQSKTLTEDQVFGILEKSAAWPYRLLQQAKKIATEVHVNE